MKLVDIMTPVMRPGWDCITGNHCENAGKPGVNHGIHGDEFVYGIRAELADGRMAAISLLVFTSRYPATVEQWRRDRTGCRAMPYGASLDLHMQLAKNAAPPHEYVSVTDNCEWLGDGRRCWADGSGLSALEVYLKYGLQSDEADVDLTKQPDALYEEMARFLRMWSEGK